MATKREIKIELLPHERDVLLKWNYTPEVRLQLESFAASDRVGTITVAPYLLGWLVSDLNHAIVKRGCRDEDAIELCERLEYVERTGDGRLDIDDWQRPRFGCPLPSNSRPDSPGRSSLHRKVKTSRMQRSHWS